jgi:hypothetical protein
MRKVEGCWKRRRREKRADYRFGGFSFTRRNLLETKIKGPVVKGG